MPDQDISPVAINKPWPRQRNRWLTVAVVLTFVTLAATVTIDYRRLDPVQRFYLPGYIRASLPWLFGPQGDFDFLEACEASRPGILIPGDLQDDPVAPGNLLLSPAANAAGITHFCKVHRPHLSTALTCHFLCTNIFADAPLPQLFRLTIHPKHRNDTAWTTSDILQTERENIALMIAGRAAVPVLIPPDRISERHVNTLDNKGPGNQREAARQILSSTDRIQGLQGAAGTGKTFTLRVIREELQDEGWHVRGFAPTAKASKQLADTGMEVSMLQSFLIEARTTANPEQPHHRTVYVLDESSLADARQVNQLIRRLHEEDRLILVGDVRQHEAVGAGRAFAQLQ